MDDERLSGMKIAVLATDMVEEVELTEPQKALEDAGAEVELLSVHDGKIVSANHFDKSASYKVDGLIAEANPDEYEAVLLPGGALNADLLRVDEDAKEFVAMMDELGKPIAVICHASWLLVSAGLVEGRRLTSYHTLADDIRNAGGDWIDDAVVVDGNWVSSRKPEDIPVFNEAMINLFAQHNIMKYYSQ